MKLLYASLAALAAADFLQQVDNLIESVYSHDPDGGYIINLEPFYTLSYSETVDGDNVLYSWDETFSFTGNPEPFHRVAEFTERDDGFLLNMSLSGRYDEIPPELGDLFDSAGVPDFPMDDEFVSFQIDENWDLSISESGFQFGQIGGFSSINENGSTDITWEGNYSADVEIEEDFVTTIIDLEWGTDNAGFDQDYYMDTLNSQGKVKIEAGLDVAECGVYFTALDEGDQKMKGIVCDIEIDSDVEVEFMRDEYKFSVENDINMQGVKISFTSNIAIGDEEEIAYTILVRGEDDEDKAELLSTGNYYALYFHEGGSENTRKRMKENDATLVWRHPGQHTIDNELVPILNEKIIEPSIALFEISLENFESIPHLITWFDKFLGNIKEDRFDFSNFIEKARFNTDLSEHEDFNQFLQDQAILLNDDLIDNVFKCEDMEIFFTESREYLHDLTDKTVGKDHYEDVWGDIF